MATGTKTAESKVELEFIIKLYALPNVEAVKRTTKKVCRLIGKGFLTL